jgi:cobalt/nickel transport system permease protein
MLLWIKEARFLLYILPFLWIVSYKDFVKLNKKVIKSILFFNLGVSLGYLLMSYLKGVSPVEFLIYINLKVYVLTYFVFYFFSKVNIIEFFSFSKELSYLLMISLSQIISYKKTFEDFKLAYKARVIKKIRQREKKFITWVFEFFMKKALYDSKERSIAMKARGFFD